MDLFVVGATFDVVGKILIGISVLIVHKRIMNERKIDRRIIAEMKKEQAVATIGILFIVAGYLIHINNL